jgi:hypothetical protein
MAILKARYTTTRASAKARIKYITHRPDRDGNRAGRELFDSQGRLSRLEAYRMIDQAEQSDYFYHLVISPDPKAEDAGRDLHLRLLAQETLLSLGRSLGEPVSWAGAIHADHAPHRHVHILAIAPHRLNRDTLTLM